MSASVLTNQQNSFAIQSARSLELSERLERPNATGVLMYTTASGLEYKDLKTGEGDLAARGHIVYVHYTGWIAGGKKFDSSVGGEPFGFKLGAGQVIAGWDEGVAGMRVGGKRKLWIPAALGYGRRGSPPDIPPNAELVFEVELLE